MYTEDLSRARKVSISVFFSIATPAFIEAEEEDGLRSHPLHCALRDFGRRDARYGPGITP